jgi:hypothetical protein
LPYQFSSFSRISSGKRKLAPSSKVKVIGAKVEKGGVKVKDKGEAIKAATSLSPLEVRRRSLKTATPQNYLVATLDEVACGPL